MASLQWRLVAWLSLAIAVVALVSGMYSYRRAFSEAHELQDAILRQVVGLVRDGRETATQPSRDGESQLRVQRLGPAGADSGALPLAADLPDGLQTVTLPSGSYRVAVLTHADGSRVAVSQATEVRDEIARDTAMHTLRALGVLVPVLALISALLVRGALGPVRRLARHVEQRRETDLQPLALAGLPLEVSPFVEALNRLFADVRRHVEAQQRFVSDAAHEMRSPLAALSLQAERLAEADIGDTARGRLQVLLAGIQRSRHLVEQLLLLARVQVAEPVPGVPPAPASVVAVYRRVLEDLLPLAEAKGIDLGLGEAADLRVPLSEFELFTIIRNLVDNAIRYVPPRGRIDLIGSDAGAFVDLLVTDDGPGIPAEERGRVFDPFYRVLGTEVTGSGLGLSIVKSVVDRAGGTVALEPSMLGARGLCVRVRLPKPGVGGHPAL